MEDIHDIRPPVMVGWDPDLTVILAWVLAGLVLAGLTGAAVRYFRRRARAGAPAKALAYASPYDTAVSTLNRLATGPDAKAFYFQLGRAVKAYIGGTFGINCLELTTQELGRRVRDIPAIPGRLKSEIILFQDLCDPFRYAPLEPDQARIQKDLARGRDLIDAVEAAVKNARTPTEENQT